MTDTETYTDTWEYGALNGRFASIASANCGGGYDWDDFHVMRGVDGLLYVGEGSGCSCDSFSSSDPDGFTRVLSWQEAADHVKTWIADGDEWRNRDTEGMELIETLARIRPKARIEIDPRKPWGAK